MALFRNISEEEQNVVDQLKRRTISDLTPKMLEDESLFYRFCKARNFNLEDAEAMLKKHIAWRKELKIDTILLDYKPSEVIQKYIPYSFVCFDKEGCVVRYIDSGGVDLRGLWNSATKYDMFKYLIFALENDMEKLKNQSRKLGKPVTNIIYVYNFEHLTFSNATHRKSIETLLNYYKAYQDNYPETLKYVFAINVSSYFNIVFSACKAILDSEVINKVRCYSSDSWKEDLLEMIDADELPAFLGGKKTDPDGNPLCNSFIKHAHKVPESYYFCNREKTFPKEEGVKKITISPFSKEEICFKLEEIGSHLEWEFETERRDIRFAIYYQENSSEEYVELIPKKRMDTCYGPEKGFCKCEKLGTYVIVFDNSYSWIHSKEIYYRAGIKSIRRPSEADSISR